MNIPPSSSSDMRSAAAAQRPGENPSNAARSQALFSAIERADLAAVRQVLDGAALNLSFVNDQGQTPLHLAMALRRHDIAALLLANTRHDLREAINARDQQGYTPLMLAADAATITLAGALIERGARMDADSILQTESPADGSDRMIAAHNIAWLLSRTNGNVAAAHGLAQRRGVDCFEAMFAEPHAALRQACVEGNRSQIDALMQTGLDASFVLMRMLQRSAPLSTGSALAVRRLIDAGADTSWAMAHAAYARSAQAIKALVTLGASGDAALYAAVTEADETAINLLLGAGVKADSTLIDLAKRGRKDGVSMLLAHALATKNLDVTHVMVSLAQQGRQGALELLLAQGLQPRSAMLELLDQAHRAGVCTLRAAGADTSELLASLATGAPDVADRVVLLKNLIESGADPQPTLYERLNANDLTTAKILLIAHANIDDACDYALARSDAAALNKLRQIDKDLQRLNTIYAAGGFGIHGALRLALAQDYLASPASLVARELIDTWEGSRNSPAGLSQVLSALRSLDWNALRQVDPLDISVAAALLFIARLGDLPLARLLAQIKASPILVLANAVNTNETDRLSFLHKAGFSPAAIISVLLLKGNVALAKALVEKDGLEVYPMLDESLEVDEGIVKAFVPALSDGRAEFAQALAQGNTRLVKALIAAGAEDPDRALASAVADGQAQAVQILLSLGADLSKAVVHALKAGRPDAAQNLLYLGADAGQALRHATAMKDRTLMEALIASMRA